MASPTFDCCGRKQRFATPSSTHPFNQHCGRPDCIRSTAKLTSPTLSTAATAATEIFDNFFSDVIYQSDYQCTKSSTQTAAIQPEMTEAARQPRFTMQNLFRFSSSAASFNIPRLDDKLTTLSNNNKDVNFHANDRIRFIDDNDHHFHTPLNDENQKWLFPSPLNEKQKSKRQNILLSSAFITEKRRRRLLTSNNVTTPRAQTQINYSTKMLVVDDCRRQQQHNRQPSTTTQKTTTSSSILAYFTNLWRFIKMRPCEACVVGASVLFTMLFVPTLLIGLMNIFSAAPSSIPIAIPTLLNNVNSSPISGATPFGVDDYVDDEIFDVFLDNDRGPYRTGDTPRERPVRTFDWLNSQYSNASTNNSLLTGRRSSRDLLRAYYISHPHHRRRFQTSKKQVDRTQLFDRFGFYGPNDEADAVFGRATRLINKLGGGGNGAVVGGVDWPPLDLFRPPPSKCVHVRFNVNWLVCAYTNIFYFFCAQ